MNNHNHQPRSPPQNVTSTSATLATLHITEECSETKPTAAWFVARRHVKAATQ